MFFGELPIDDALGGVLAHSLMVDGQRIRKGTLIEASLIERLRASDVATIVVALPGPADTMEDIAASELANAIAGEGIRVDTARTGRVNCFAQRAGLLHFNRETILAINAVTPAITLATLPENQIVESQRMLATIKIIPYAVERAALDQVLALCREPGLVVSPIVEQNAHLIQTRQPATKEKLLDKTSKVTTTRLAVRKTNLVSESRCQHTVAGLTAALEQLQATLAKNANDTDWILIAGASAISDMADVVPAAIIGAGGDIKRFGIPVDPGNLLLLGALGKHPIVGMPGCARSPKYNGFDQVLDRLACQVPIDNSWLDSLCIGGLMGEILERPSPRIEPASKPERVGVLLAAGSSNRFGADNKLLASFDDETVCQRSFRQLLNSAVDRIVVVTGHEQAKIEANLRQCHPRDWQPGDDQPPVTYCHNAAYASGMASSLTTAISTLSVDSAAVICLADMPLTDSSVIDQLLQAQREHPTMAAFAPIYNGAQGNPVVITAALFDDVLSLSGDTGARALLRANADRVYSVDVTDAGVVTDVDTPEALASALTNAQNSKQ